MTDLPPQMKQGWDLLLPPLLLLGLEGALPPLAYRRLRRGSGVESTLEMCFSLSSLSSHLLQENEVFLSLTPTSELP